MPDTGASAWRRLFGCCELGSLTLEKAKGQAASAELAPMPRTSVAPQGKESAGLPPDQISLRSLTATNPTPVRNPQPQDDSATQSTLDVQNKPTGLRTRGGDIDALDEQQIVLRQYWAEAIAKVKASKDGDKLCQVMQACEDVQADDTNLTLNELICRLEQEMTRVGLKRTMADTLDKVVPHLNRFAIVGDIAVSSNPNPAALPWAAVRFILLNLAAGGDIKAKIVESTAKVTILVLECSIYQKLYLTSLTAGDSEVFTRLREVIVDSFVRSIRFLCFALNRQRSRAKVVSDALKLEDFDGYLRDLREAEVQLHNAGGLCDKHQSSQSRGECKDLHELMIGLNNEIKNERLRSRLKDLLPADSWDASHHIYHPADSFCLDGTREAVLAEIHAWINNSNGTSICWLPGLAGTGKSTISRTIARDLRENGLAASFFFKRGVASGGNAKLMIPIIAYQLALNFPPVAEHIADIVSHDPLSVTAPLDIQWLNLILNPLSKLHVDKLPKTLVLVIDALDECDGESDRKEILRLFTKSCPATLKVFLTSRPELDIEGYFASKKSHHREIVLHRVKRQVIEKDIETFLKYAINDFASAYNESHPRKESQLVPEWPGQARLQVLITRSVPLFIAAATFIRMIRDSKWTLSPDRKVDFIIKKSGNVASAYGALYEPVLSLVLNGSPDEARSETKEIFAKTIGSIILLADPLSLTSLASLLGVDVPEIESQIDALRSVLDISSNDSPIRLFHLSFRDYLLSEKAGHLRVEESEAHANLARRCLEILATRLKTDICGLGSPGKSRFEVDEETIKKHLPSEVQYACLYWVYHLKKSESRMQDGDDDYRAEGMLKFLQNSFLNWLEALCLMGRALDSPLIIDELQGVIDDNGGSELLQFIRDAKHFIRQFHMGLEQTPLQLYHSGIVFSPRKSIAPRPLEDRQYPKWITQPPLLVADSAASLHTFESSHGDQFCHIAFLPNGRLASSSSSGKVQIWDPASGSCLQTLQGQTASVYLFTSWESSRIASCSNNLIEIWNLDDSTCVQHLAVENPTVSSLAFSDDGRFLCSISTSSGDQVTKKVHDLDTRECLRELQITSHPRAFSLSQGSQWMAETRGGLIMLSKWDKFSDTHRATLRLSDDNMIDAAEFSTGGTLLVAMSGSPQRPGIVKIWCPETGECLHSLYISQSLSQFGWYRPGLTQDWLAFVSMDHGAIIVNLTTKAVSYELDSISVCRVTFSVDGKLLATQMEMDQSLIKTRHPTSIFSPQTMDIHSGAVGFMTRTFDDNTLLSASPNEIKIWDVSSGACQETLEIIGSQVSKAPLVAVAQNAFLFAIQREDEIQVWRFGPLRLIQTLGQKYSQPRTPARCLAFSANGERVALGLTRNSGSLYNTKGSIEVWEVKTGKLVQRLEAGLFWRSSIALSPDGTRLAYATPATFEIRNITGNQRLSTRIGYELYGYPQLTFSFDGQQLTGIWGSWNGLILKTSTGKPLCECRSRLDFPKFPLDPSFLNLESISFTASIPESLQIEDVLKVWHISHDGIWLMKHGERLLWLPPDYRPRSACVSGSTIIIGTDSGRVLFLHLEDWA